MKDSTKKKKKKGFCLAQEKWVCRTQNKISGKIWKLDNVAETKIRKMKWLEYILKIISRKGEKDFQL